MNIDEFRIAVPCIMIPILTFCYKYVIMRVMYVNRGFTICLCRFLLSLGVNTLRVSCSVYLHPQASLSTTMWVRGYVWPQHTYSGVVR